MSETAKHTPTPWVLEKRDRVFHGGKFEWGGPLIISGDEGTEEGFIPVALVHEDGPEGWALANAEYIVRAVNAHDELVAALRGLLVSHLGLLIEHYRDGDNTYADDQELQERAESFMSRDQTCVAARAALAKIGGGK